jgi:Fungalysin metallopeptidase (M36)
MSINFIPNDPAAGSTGPAIRVKNPRPNRPASKSGFTFTGASPEGTAAPVTPQFLFWQCREAALAAVEAWEASAGAHTKWQGNRKKLPLRQDTGEDLNAFYDRASFSFFHQAVGGTTFFSGASTDVVAHETGHGLLDSVRPEFFDVNFLEVGAFHEAFGDCIAILTALGDQETRQKLLAVTTDLRKRNFVESTAEELSKGIGKLIPGHNAAEPRHAFNTFKFQLPTSLPDNGGPGVLINEVHSFGMIFTGCFWDLIANLFGASTSKTEAALLTAAQLAGEILIAGGKAAVVTPRFLQSVGRGMMLADQSLHGGANQDHIRDAFKRHDILVGTSVTLVPSMALAGNAPKGASLGAATRRDLVKRLDGGRGAKLRVGAMNVFGTRVVNVVHTRDVPLGGLDDRLKGVVAVAHEQVLVGGSGGRAAIMGALPHAEDTDAEVKSFVESLLKHGRIELGGKSKKKGLVASVNRGGDTTHAIKTEGGKKVLRRIRFRCECCS